MKCKQQLWRAAEDVILLSPTGSGKTLGFLLPLLNLLDSKDATVQVLIWCLRVFVQIEQVLRRWARALR